MATVSPVTGHEQIPEAIVGRWALLQGIHIAQAIRHRTRHAPKQVSKLFPTPWSARQEAWRLGQPKPEQAPQHQGQRSADEEQHPPPVERQYLPGEQAGQHASQGNTDDGRCYGKGAMPCRRELGRHGGGAGQCTAYSQTGNEAQQGNRQGIRSQADRTGRGAEEEHAGDDSHPTSEAVSEQPRTRTANPHPDESSRYGGSERLTCDAPLLDHQRDGKANQLPVEAIQDNRKRGHQDHDLLHPGVRPLVEQGGDIGRLSAKPRLWGHCIQHVTDGHRLHSHLVLVLVVSSNRVGWGVVFPYQGSMVSVGTSINTGSSPSSARASSCRRVRASPACTARTP